MCTYYLESTFLYVKFTSTKALPHLEVVLNLVLQEAGVVLQGLSEPGNVLTDLQQLDWVSIVVPAGGDILQSEVDR